jgi:tetratricopeptide (TPR) repeat protein
MAIDAYAACPCGSGKKFKWCCQPIHGEIDQAFEQHNAGQHEAAITALKAVAESHADNPEAWGRYAQLLAINNRVDDAEKALDRAFAVNPNYAFGYLVRGQFRVAEGELVGGLMLFRKAADLYSPEAGEPLAFLAELIADLELRLNRPVAARAAFHRAAKLLPTNPTVRQAFDELFGPASRLPACARREYVFRPAASPPPGWPERLQQAASGRLGDAMAAFRSLTEECPDDPAGWFNLGLVKAWLGDNRGALEALSRSVELDTDEERCAEAWALAEVLRCGDGMLDECDYAEHRAAVTIREPEPVMALLETWEKAQRLAGMRANTEQGLLTGLVLEGRGGLIEAAGGPAFAPLGAYLVVAGALLQLWHTNPDILDRVVAETQQALGPSAVVRRERGPVMFSDVVIEAMVYPTRATTALDAELKVRERAAGYFEEKWLQRPLKSLGGVPPVDAAGHAVLRRKLRGVVQFLQDCAAHSGVHLYDFDRLRRKLGLSGGGGTLAATDFGSMSAADLAGVAVNELTRTQLGEAFRAAATLDANEVAARFARAWIDHPAAEPGDAWPYFHHLIARALRESHFDEAVELVDEGEKADCERNEGRRRNDYELRRAQVLAKADDPSAAAETFRRLIERSPDELRFAVSAAETMLGLKRGNDALEFAESGLKQARAQNNRDAEENLLELAEAAKRQVQ